MIGVLLFALADASTVLNEDLRKASQYVERRMLERQRVAASLQSQSAARRVERWRVGMEWKVAVVLAMGARNSEQTSVERVFHFRVKARDGNGAVLQVRRLDRPEVAAELRFDFTGRLVRASDSYNITGVDFFPAYVPIQSENQYKSRDSLGRIYKVVWPENAPWPTRVRAGGGVARLLKEEE